MEPQSYFRVPLVRDPQFPDEVWCPKPELGRAHSGVSATFLAHAEEYFRRYENFDGAGDTLGKHLKRLGIALDGVAIDIGSGFGNSVIPILVEHKKLKVISTDISPDLLSILRREAKARGLGERCAAIAMDAQEDYFESQSVDFALGLAILHHLVEPGKAISAVLKALRPGGRAVFLEPFQAGHFVQRVAFEQVLSEAGARNETGPAFDALRSLTVDIHTRSHRKVLPNNDKTWEQLDDKWLFSRAHFERIAEDVGCSDIEIEPVATRDDFLRCQAQVALTLYYGLELSALPQWAWAIIDRYDHDYLAPDMKGELLMHGVVVVTR